MNLLKELRKTNYLIRSRRPPHQAGAPILRASGLSVHYESGPVLDDVGARHFPKCLAPESARK